MATLSSSERTRIRDILTVFGQDEISDQDIEVSFGHQAPDGFTMRHLLDLAFTMQDSGGRKD